MSIIYYVGDIFTHEIEICPIVSSLLVQPMHVEDDLAQTEKQAGGLSNS